MINENNKNSWCVNPYLNLSVQPNGNVKPCCMSTLKYTTEDGAATLNKGSILNFWNSKSRTKMIDDLNNGIQIPECTACWKEEHSGKESKRIRDNQIYKDKQVTADMLPVVLDLSMGNLCNIKCRICSPGHSTPWVIEESKVQFPNDPKKYTNWVRWDSFKESYDYENKFFWDDIEELLSNAERFDFAGGEPFYIEKHWNIVKKCVDNGWSKNQHIHYNTNGTIYPEKYIDLLNQFKIVDIQVSSDGVGKKFEYMRHPANWKTSEEVIDKLCAVRDNSDTTWLIGVCLSVSAFNVFDFFETYEHYASKGVRIYVNVVHDHHGVRVLPDNLKTIVINRLRQLQSKYNAQQWQKECNMICNYLENTNYNDNDWREFWRELKMRDAIRKESFEETFPEYFEEIKKFLI
jgi:MoaA/NifB/PqqE/SkfB family radical SAM enzyme